jgi:DNA-binding transcriptional MerR regulator
MKTPRKKKPPVPRAGKQETETAYTLEVVCEIVGVPRQAILHYKEHGLISAITSGGPGNERFNDDAVRALRRIEHLRISYEMNLQTLTFTLNLLNELERLRDDLGSRR